MTVEPQNVAFRFGTAVPRQPSPPHHVVAAYRAGKIFGRHLPPNGTLWNIRKEGLQ